MNKKKKINILTEHCKRCELRQKKCNLLIGNGDMNCDILYLWKYPGISEKIMNSAMVGEHILIMEYLQNEALKLSKRNKSLSKYYLNCLLCVSKGLPNKYHFLACKTNILIIIKIINPKLIILLGDVSKQFYQKEFPESITLVDPEIHKVYGTNNSPTFSSDVIKLSEAINNL